MKSPYFSDYFCEKIIVIDKILSFPWWFKVRSLVSHYPCVCGNLLNIGSGEGECPVEPGEAYICLGGGTPLKRPINMAFRD